jgi:hypothetical protein
MVHIIPLFNGEKYAMDLVKIFLKKYGDFMAYLHI